MPSFLPWVLPLPRVALAALLPVLLVPLLDALVPPRALADLLSLLVLPLLAAMLAALLPPSAVAALLPLALLPLLAALLPSLALAALILLGLLALLAPLLPPLALAVLPPLTLRLRVLPLWCLLLCCLCSLSFCVPWFLWCLFRLQLGGHPLHALLVINTRVCTEAGKKAQASDWSLSVLRLPVANGPNSFCSGCDAPWGTHNALT